MIWPPSAQHREVQHGEQAVKDLLVMIYKGTITLTTQVSYTHTVTTHTLYIH